MYRHHYAGTNAGENIESVREGGGPHLETPHYGLLTISGGAAMAMQKYFNKYGGTEEQLGEIAVSHRQWACTNPYAYFYGQPMTREDYLNSRYVVEPLRLFDHSLPGNAGYCIIVSSAERAKDCRTRPVYISGFQGSVSGKGFHVMSRWNLGIGQQPDEPYTPPKDMLVYRMAGVEQKDVDILGILDAFSVLVLFGLEEFGFCKEGEALDFIQGGRTAPGGELPINTSGGGLSDCENFGWGHEISIVRHLRGEMGEHQIPYAEVAQYLSTDRSSIILTVK
jgi:acetyl-CoA acetyltransferase